MSGRSNTNTVEQGHTRNKTGTHQLSRARIHQEHQEKIDFSRIVVEVVIMLMALMVLMVMLGLVRM